MKKNSFFIPLLLVIFFIANTAPAHAISWETDLAKALKDASVTKKPLMVDFYTDWCGWCKKLDADTYSDKIVNDAAEHFTCVKVNADKYREMTAKYGVRGYPTIIFLNYKGDIEDTQVGYLNAASLKTKMDKVLQKNPAVLPDKPAQLSDKPEADRRPRDPFRLGGIMATGAIVNDKIVRAGDVVDGAKVVSIKRNSVKLAYEGKDIVLNLED